MEQELTSMVDFVLDRENMAQQKKNELERDLYILAQYAHFLRTPLELGMFVPCDEEGSVLEEPDHLQIIIPNALKDITIGVRRQYQEAKNRVLFEGSNKISLPNSRRQFLSWIDYNKYKTIEDITSLDLTLTQEGSRQINS